MPIFSAIFIIYFVLQITFCEKRKKRYNLIYKTKAFTPVSSRFTRTKNAPNSPYATVITQRVFACRYAHA